MIIGAVAYFLLGVILYWFNKQKADIYIYIHIIMSHM